MALTVFYPGPGRTPPIPRGEMTIGQNGLCNFPIASLSMVKIDDVATVLFDRETGEVVLRRPVEGETPMKLTAVSGGACRRISLAGVFKALGVEPKPGRRKTTVELGMIGFKVEE